MDRESLEKLEKSELITLIEKLTGEKQRTGQSAKIGDEVPKRQRGGKPKRAFDPSKWRRRHIALHIAYLGDDLHGLAKQPGVETVEGHLFAALQKTRLVVDRDSANFSRSGRTDAGVSAAGQVVAFFARSKAAADSGVQFVPWPGTEAGGAGSGVGAGAGGSEAAPAFLPDAGLEGEIDYPYVLNKVLPPTVRVLGWAPVPLAFSARFSCFERTYRYYFARRGLDVARMRSAAARMVGTHDFRNFAKMDVVNAKSFVRTLYSIAIEPLATDPDPSRTVFYMQVRGQAFLWHQVRSLVAVLFLVGAGEEDLSVIDALLDVGATPRRPAYALADPRPLVLWGSRFPGLDFALSRAAAADLQDCIEAGWDASAVRAARLRDWAGMLGDRRVRKEDGTVCLWRDVAPTPPVAYAPLTRRTKRRSLWDMERCDSYEEQLAGLSGSRKARFDMVQGLSERDAEPGRVDKRLEGLKAALELARLSNDAEGASAAEAAISKHLRARTESLPSADAPPDAKRRR